MKIMKLTMTRISVLLLLGLCLIVFSRPVPGYATDYVYYVDISQGTDDSGYGTGPGTGAWRTLHYAIQEINAISPPLIAGDSCILNVASGTYSIADEADTPLTITQDYVTIDGDEAVKPVLDGSGAASWTDGLIIWASNVVVKDLVVQNFWVASSGITISGASTNTVQNCDVLNNEYGVYIESGESSSVDNIIQNCSIHNNSYGVYLLSAGTGNTIQNCQIYSNTTFGIKIESTQGCAVLNNAVYGTGSDGIYLLYGIGSSYSILENSVYDNFSFGINVQGCSPEIKRNTIYDNGDGIGVFGEAYDTAPVIWNNLIYQTLTPSTTMYSGIVVQKQDSTSATSPQIYHNTLDNGTWHGISIGYSPAGMGDITPDIRYNIITNFGDTGIFRDAGVTGTSAGDYNDVFGNAANYSNWNAGANDKSLDPMYASYTLQAGSPCVNAIPTGDPPNDPVTEDIAGTPRPQGSGFDMGAYEYTGTPTVTTQPVTGITSTSATGNGTITSLGIPNPTSHGVCWNTTGSPTTSDPKTDKGPAATTGAFTASIAGLTPGLTYYVRAYATNAAGTSYGGQVSFTSLAIPPTVTTTAPSAITSTTATSGGNVTSAGGSTVTARGVCWSTSANPTTSNSHTSDGTGTGAFTSSITGLTPAITYHVRAYATNAAGTAYGNDIPFTTGSPATAITGKVTRDSDGQPVQGVQICAWPFTGGSSSCATSQSDGTYTISGVAPGYLKVEASGVGYLTEYYNNAYDPNWATAVWSAAGQTTPNINFSMGAGGSISGKVFKSDGVTPLANVCVGAYMHQCGSNRYAGAQTDAGGAYTISNLPPQVYYLRTNASCTSPQHYQKEWYRSTGHTLICDQAEAVTVASGKNTPGINFSLAASEATYPGPDITSSAVFSAHYADESIATSFWARISGPSPEDVASFTVTGPSGTFNLVLLDPPFRQLATSYQVNVPSIVQNGAYTFAVTDSLGRTATVQKTFTYSSAVPQVDSSTMKVNGMGDRVYVGTTTPTLTWDEVVWPGTPGYYQVFIWDYDGRAIWYTETTADTSLAVPAGWLQPDTPYYWYVRTQDPGGENRRYSNSRYFCTGLKGLPDLSHTGVLSFVMHDVKANWFPANRINLAPWDIHSFYVNGPKGTHYPYNQRSQRFNVPVYYASISRGGPIPMPDGAYVFELSDNESNTDTKTHDFTYNPVPAVSEYSRYPGPNAYLYKSATYSWAPVSDERTLYYKVRISDYNSQVVWYESPYSTETTVTIPEDVSGRAPYGSYKWQVIVSDSATQPNNVTFSSARTITKARISSYIYTLPGGTGAATDYRIFTIPLYTGTVRDLLELMEKTLGPYSPTGRWRIFLYMNNRYYEINDPVIQSMPYTPGHAAWIISRDTIKVPFTGGAVPQGAYSLKLKGNSWHLIGLPFSSTAIDLKKIAVTDGTHTYLITDAANNLTAHVMWEYTGSGPASGYVARGVNDTLTPGTGYFFKVNAPTDVTVLIPPDNTETYFSADSVSGLQDKKLDGYKEEPPPPPPGSQPMPDIKANGQDGPVRISSGAPVSVAVTLDPGSWDGREADWWIAAYSPFGWYTYVHPAEWRAGIHRCVQAPLFELSTPVEVLNMALPAGHYIFYFALDGNTDGAPDGTWMDSVNVEVE